MNVVEFSKAKDGETRLSEDFKVKEFACQDGSDKILIDLDMIPVLQKIRDIGGRLTINSAYRTISHNKAVGGVTNSYHTKGRAFDIVSEKLSTSDVCNLANTLGVNGIIKYPTFVHIDSRETKYHADDKGNKLTYGYYDLPKTEEEQKKFIQDKCGYDDNTMFWLSRYIHHTDLFQKWYESYKR